MSVIANAAIPNEVDAVLGRLSIDIRSVGRWVPNEYRQGLWT